MGLIRRFMKDETAATAIEYGLIAGLIAVVVIASLKKLGADLSNKFQAVSNNLS
jgi:pilus assembly protein Flp/PilA